MGDIQLLRRVETEIRRALRSEIWRTWSEERGQVKVWNGRTVGALGVVNAAGTAGRRYSERG